MQQRRTAITLGSVGVVVAVAAAGGLAVANQKTSQAAAASKHSVQADVHVENKQSAVSGAVETDHDTLPAVSSSSPPADNNISSPDASNTNNSSTTITMNGQTTRVNGDVSIDKSYTTDDGAGSVSHVNISVHTNSSSTSSDVQEDDDTE